MAGIPDVALPVLILAFIAKASVKNINKSLLSQLPKLDRPRLHAMLINPEVKFSADIPGPGQLLFHSDSFETALCCPEYA
ncbi:hypothetical protein E2F51_00565 (plasmid) [Erwinia sp. QL-Z3]|nr:hypothetical protein E2F51_00565 [Erwinia sp. QL-Z3]